MDSFFGIFFKNLKLGQICTVISYKWRAVTLSQQTVDIWICVWWYLILDLKQFSCISGCYQGLTTVLLPKIQGRKHIICPRKELLSRDSTFSKTWPLINPYLQISGKFLRPFHWKTHPIVNWRILGRHTGRFTGKLIQTKCFISYMVSVNWWVFQ